MKLLRITLRSFRGVHDREIRPAERGVTVLEGDNEVGKTSTLQALDMLVDDPDSSRKAHVRAAAPTHADAGPEVEAEIATGPYRFVYRKRWKRAPITELTVLTPRREQLTGREAHDRVRAILAETVDSGLWKALRVEQHTPLGQADLGGHAALTRALDRAAGGPPDADSPTSAAAPSSADAASGPEGAAGLVERAEQELRRYRTATGRATGELRAAEDRLDAARAEHDAAAAAVHAVEADAAEQARVDDGLRALLARRRAHRAAVGELEEQWLAVQSRRAEVDAAAGRAQLARERADTAGLRRRTRDDAVAALAAAAEGLRAADAARTAHEDRLDTLRAVREERGEVRDAARRAADAAAAGAATADAVLAAAHDHAELAVATARLARVQDAEAALRAADTVLAASTLTDADADRLEGLALDAVRAEAALGAGAAVLEVHGEGSEIDLDGDAVVLDAAGREVVVCRPVVLTVGGVRVRVRPGHDARRLAEAAQEAAGSLARACADLGVASPADARAAREQARDAGRRREAALAALAQEGPADAVRAAVAALRTRRPADATGAAATGATGATDITDADGAAGDAVPDVGAARSRARAARDDADSAATAAAAADAAWHTADAAVRAGDTDRALRAKDAADARHAHDRAAADLAAARARATDAELAAEESQARALARETGAEHERLAAALADDDPASLEQRVSNARHVDERLSRETAELDQDRARLSGRLQLAGSEGRHDRSAAASDALVAAERDHIATARRARAAALLHGTLVRHRDAVRRAYVTPFRREVERLARIVFGPDLALEVDERLRIVARTLDGVTVAFDELSAGAKEQLGLCARLACAALVDPADGVPVIIDDALGHCDDERLARLGAVFAAATHGADHQILVLTCNPGRYRGVGAAHVVRLLPSRSPAGSWSGSGREQRDRREDEAVGHRPAPSEGLEDDAVDLRSRHPQPRDERAVG